MPLAGELGRGLQSAFCLRDATAMIEMPDPPDQLSDDELRESLSESIDALQELPLAISNLRQQLKNIVREIVEGHPPDNWQQQLAKLAGVDLPDIIPERQHGLPDIAETPAAEPNVVEPANETLRSAEHDVVTDIASRNTPAVSENSVAANENFPVDETNIDEILTDVSRLIITHERLRELSERIVTKHHVPGVSDELRQINSVFTAQAVSLQRNTSAVHQIPVAAVIANIEHRLKMMKLTEFPKIHCDSDTTTIDRSIARPMAEICVALLQHQNATPDPSVTPAISLSIRTEDDLVRIVVTHRGNEQTLHDSDLRPMQASLQAVHGRLCCETSDSQATTVRIEIPCRQAVSVIKGLLVRQDDELFVIPFDQIIEILDLDNSSFTRVLGVQVMTVRNEAVATWSLQQLLGTETNRNHSAPTEKARQQGVLLKHDGDTLCLLVDAVIGQRRILVDRTSQLFRTNPLVDGVAQLGGGQLALILSAARIFDTAVGGQQSAA